MKNNVFINRVSYNAHYVKWGINWGKFRNLKGFIYEQNKIDFG